MNDFVKKPGASSTYTTEQLYDVERCQEDPFYFIEKFMKVQHPMKGSLPLKLYPNSRSVWSSAFHKHDKVIALTARQMGKCVAADTEVSVNGESREIASLIPMSPRERLVTWLESKLVDLVPAALTASASL
jgi:hypothetical protein